MMNIIPEAVMKSFTYMLSRSKIHAKTSKDGKKLENNYIIFAV